MTLDTSVAGLKSQRMWPAMAYGPHNRGLQQIALGCKRPYQPCPSLSGFPLCCAGFKIGKYNHLHQAVPEPAALSRDFTKADEEALRGGVRRFFPTANGPINAAMPCMFVNTPDSHFLIDRHPRHPQVGGSTACWQMLALQKDGYGELAA